MSPSQNPLQQPFPPATFLQPFALPENFIPATQADAAREASLPAWWFVCHGSELLVARNISHCDRPPLPQALSLTEELGLTPVRTQFLGYLGEHPCLAVELAMELAAGIEKTDDKEKLPAAVTENYRFCHLRSLYGVLSEDLFAIAARAVQIVAWDRTHQYCGQCATPTIQLPTERAKRCPNCQLRQYPRLSPAVIMLIHRGPEILLARAPRFRPGMYSVLAGFVEPGESLEETVIREVKEEVGISIKNIRYFGSQPWPFPNSLMVGFVAEYASGTLAPDPAEIEAAAWFTPDNLPPVPGQLSIARKLIDWFLTTVD